MKYRNVFLFFALLCLTACGVNPNIKQRVDTSLALSADTIKPKTKVIQEKLNNIDCDKPTTFNLDYGFKLEFCDSDEFEVFKTFSYLKLIRETQTIFRDTSLKEYEVTFKLNPIVLKTDTSSFEVLLEVNDRPCKNFLMRFFVTDNKLTKIDSLPTFEANPSDLNHDGIQEYAGYREYGEYFGKNWSVFTYQPIYYYSLTSKGLKLDTAMTDERNRYICKLKPKQRYHGIDVSQTIVDRFDKEIDRIKKNK